MVMKAVLKNDSVEIIGCSNQLLNNLRGTITSTCWSLLRSISRRSDNQRMANPWYCHNLTWIFGNHPDGWQLHRLSTIFYLVPQNLMGAGIAAKSNRISIDSMVWQMHQNMAVQSTSSLGDLVSNPNFNLAGFWVGPQLLPGHCHSSE